MDLCLPYDSSTESRLPRELELGSQAVSKIGEINNKYGKPTSTGNRNEKPISKEIMKVTIIHNTNIWLLVELKMITDRKKTFIYVLFFYRGQMETSE